MTPVEELVDALGDMIDIASESDNKSLEDRRLIEQAKVKLSRFNAERGDGVWVPREPTEAMMKAHQAYCDTRHASGNSPTAVGAWRAMIAAINPEDEA